MRNKENAPIYHLGKMYDDRMLFKPASIKDVKDSHQFSCKIQGEYVRNTCCCQMCCQKYVMHVNLIFNKNKQLNLKKRT